MPVTAREAALSALTAYRTRDARPDVILNNIAEKEKLDRRDAALASHITNGVLQNREFCDYYILLFSGRKLNYFDPVILDILRISTYQLLFLTKVPPHAAVSEGVALAKKHSRSASGLVNAVLRKIADNRANLPEIRVSGDLKNLAVKYSHPEWLVSILCDEYGAEACESILAADNTPAPVTVIANTLKGSTEEVKASLAEEGVNVEQHPFLDNAFYVSGSGAIDSLSTFKNGLIYAQDVAAYLAVYAAAPSPGQTVLDVCAAPGGKSFAAAIAMQNTGRIISGDIHEKKLKQITEGAKRLGIDIIEVTAHDGRLPFEGLKGACDVVITDVPCSGLGVIRKKPEIRYKKPEELERLPDIQLAILENAAENVRPGGVLLYSTCTILKRENDSVIQSFLEKNKRFSLEAFSLPGPFGEYSGMATLLPYIGDTDGFFICKMRREQ